MTDVNKDDFVAAAKEPEASVGKLAKRFGVGKTKVRALLRQHDLVLPTQETAVATTPGAKKTGDPDAAIVANEVSMAVSKQTREWSRVRVEQEIEDARLVGMVFIDRLGPRARDRGLSVHELLERALENHEAIEGLRQLYGERARVLGYSPAQFSAYLKNRVDDGLALPAASAKIARLEDTLNQAVDEIKRREPLAVLLEVFKFKVIANALGGR